MITFMAISLVVLVSIYIRVAQNLVKKGETRSKVRALLGTVSGITFGVFLELGDLYYKVKLGLIEKLVVMVFVGVVIYLGSYGVYNISLQRRIDLLEPFDSKGLLGELKKNKKELYAALSIVLIPLVTIGLIFLLLEVLS